ncbi:MAG: glycosyltransferase family 39 protein [Christensenellaceae bacterium]|nr:glycosyltransferase family 39 protein [Christensenellaceae bacterium]
MLPRRSIFGYFAISVYIISLVYMLAGGVMTLGEGREYPYLQSGLLLMLLLGGWLFLSGGAGLLARLDKERRLRRFRWLPYIEAAAAVSALGLGAMLRVLVVRALPMQPASDYQTYYEVAELLMKGTLKTDGPGYCDYIAMFPHVYGYPYVLSVVFRLSGGPSVAAAQSFNILLSVATAFIAYRTVRLAGGRLSGMVALLLTCFWPSQIIYVNMVASEYLFSFLLMLSLYLYVRTLRIDAAEEKRPVLGVCLHILLGVCLAVTAAIRPMALLLLITILICTGFEKQRLPVRLSRDQPISLILLSKGWMRCFLVLAIYLSVNALFTMGITNAVDRDLASGTTSFGYNLLVGLNTSSDGGWNQEDADYLYAALERTGSASEAHLACRDLGLQRLRDVKGIGNLFFHKFQVLWSNDDYGTTWNLLFMDQQGTLTPERERLLLTVRSWGNLFYLLVIGLAAVEGIYLWQRGAGIAYPFLLMVLGTAALHLLLENQNRYHFHALYMLAALAALGVRHITEDSRVRVQQWLEERRRTRALDREDEEKRRALLLEEENLIRLRQEAMQSRFDMKAALEKGFVTVRVSKAYADEAGVVAGPQEPSGR